MHVIAQYTRGIDAEEEALALDVVDSVGPGAHYLVLDHTMKDFRKAWHSQLFDRNGYSRWSENGAKDLQTRVREHTLSLMTRQSDPLNAEAAKKLDEMCRHWT